MTVLLDKDTSAPQEWRGKDGAGLVQVVDADGNPSDLDAAISDLADAIGPAGARPPVTDPTDEADVNQLLRGVLSVLNDTKSVLEDCKTLLQTIAENTNTES